MKDAFIRFGLSGQWNLREVQSLQGQVNFRLGVRLWTSFKDAAASTLEASFASPRFELLLTSGHFVSSASNFLRTASRESSDVADPSDLS